jgi:signal transduction histidine kinase
MRDPLFNQPRLQLTLLYAGVIGGLLLLVGGVAHFVMQRTFDRTVDRELDLLSHTLNSQLEVILQEPGKLSKTATQLIPELCLVQQPCAPANHQSALAHLIDRDYDLQLLDLNGKPIAAISEPPDQRLANPNLLASRIVKNIKGESYHLHTTPLYSRQGQQWGYLQVGRSIQQLDEYMQSLHLLVVFGVPLAMLLIGWASWGLAGLAMRPIYQSYARMQQFTADVAHELKTPIAASHAVMETAMNDSELTIDESQQALRSLYRQTQRLNQLVQDLLLLARLDYQSAGLAAMNQPICLNDLVQDIEEELAPLALAAQVDLSCKIHAEQPMLLKGNANQLYRLISNLVTNGIHYNKPNGKVMIKLSHVANNAVIVIEDTGVGIAATDLPHLFDRFYRVNQDRSRQTGGSGLGLAIGRAIVQAHGGTIQVSSQVAEGSLFTVQLPLKQSRKKWLEKAGGKSKPA